MSATATVTETPILSVRRLTMRFGGVNALQEVSHPVREDIIQAVIGPNGAGKTTLFNCISGMIQPTAGSIVFKGREIEGLAPHRVAESGIARTFQHVALFNRMTVLENVMLGRHPRTSSGFFSAGLRLPRMRNEEKLIRERASEYLDFTGLGEFSGMLAGTLPLGKQKMLEIARALATEPRLLLLDEPAGGLNMKETEELGELIQAIRGRGVTVMLVEHDMNLIMDISDQVLVLHYGRVLASGTPSEIKENSEVIEAYLGAED